MPTHLVPATDFVTNSWSGGSTKQLLISPRGSALADRNFDFRISCARVEQSGPFSDFTGYDRLLLILNGKLALSHNGHPLTLSADHDAWQFSGADTVHAELLSPHVDDFNIFVRPGVLKTAHRQSLSAQRRWQQPCQSGAGLYGALLLQGCALANEHLLDAQFPLLISSSPLTLYAEEDAQLVMFAVGSCKLLDGENPS